MTVQKFRGLFGCFNSKKLYFKSCINMKRPGMGRMIGPKTWDRIVEFFLDFLDSREPPETGWAVCVGN